MPDYLFPPPAVRSLPVLGHTARFPISRIFCVGRNYAEHAAEMGSEVDRAAPFFFTKSLTAVAESPAQVPYPPGTSDYHHEVEFVVALGAPAFRITPEAAVATVLGYGCGLDMTRRDLQAKAKEKRRPWDIGKDVEGAAVLGPLTPAGDFGQVGPQAIELEVNGEHRQTGRLSDMVHSVPEIIADLSQYYHLVPGDLIMTGTPAGVGPVDVGDKLVGRVGGLASVELTILPPE